MQTNPLLESDMITCIHNGIVQLKSHNGALFEIEGVAVITQRDLLNAKIIGCANNIAGVPSPCSMVAMIPLSAVSCMLEINNDGVIFRSQVSTILTDKGFPLILQNKSPNNDVFLDDKDNLASVGEQNTQSTKTDSNTNNTRDNDNINLDLQSSDTNQQSYSKGFQIKDSNNKPLASVQYKITTENGDEIYGITDKNGYTKRIFTTQAEIVNIEILG